MQYLLFQFEWVGKHFPHSTLFPWGQLSLVDWIEYS